MTLLNTESSNVERADGESGIRSNMILVPGGTFRMGSDRHYPEEAPVHHVSVDPFFIDRTPVTNRQFRDFVRATGHVAVAEIVPDAKDYPGALPHMLYAGSLVFSPPKHPVDLRDWSQWWTFLKGADWRHPYGPKSNINGLDNHPVVHVAYSDALAYARWAGKDLPTEAEWEKAAVGPGGQTYPWGNEPPSCDLLNYAGCLNSTSSVVSYPESASPYLALDMAGNAFEWVADWYNASYYATAPIQDPPGPDSGTSRVIRGSGFDSDSSQLASAIRRPANPDYISRDLGFRCVVQQPINFPPYCQATPYLPNAQISTPASTCQAPVAQRLGPSCKGKIPSNTILLPQGTTYHVRSAGYQCTDAIVGGMLQVTCTGPDSTSGTLEVCNSTCTDQAPPTYSESPVCDPGYAYDPATRQCTYAPQSAVTGTQTCPAGYALDSTGLTCRPTIGSDNQCPLGQYYDSLFGGCVPGNGQANCNLYGILDATLVSSCTPGCPAGYAFNSTSLCCQAPATGLYPDCQPGLMFDPAISACVPRIEQVSAETGCTFVSVDMLQCAPLYNCGQHTTEGTCIRNKSNGCTWNEKAGACEYVK
jgi:formylglycine-generating enzyme required for sulfatase activity